MARASIRKGRPRKDGTIPWVLDYSDDNIDAEHPHGHRHLQTFDLRKQAVERRDKIMGEVKAGTHTPDHKSAIINDVINLLLNNKTIYCRRSSLETFTANMRTLQQYPIVNIKLSRLIEQNVWDLFEDIARDITLQSAYRLLDVFKELIHFAKLRRLCNQSVVDVVTSVNPKRLARRKKTTGVEVPLKEEVRLLLENASSYQDLFVTAAFTGMRPGELRALHFEDIDFDKREINVRRAANRWGEILETKTEARQRGIPIGPTVFDTLWRRAFPLTDSNVVELARRKPTGLVFPGAKLPVIGHMVIEENFHRLQMRIGMFSNDPTKVLAQPRSQKRAAHAEKVMPIIREIQEQGIGPTGPHRSGAYRIARELVARGVLTAGGREKQRGVNILRMIRRDEGKVPRYTVYSLRHFAASLFIESGFTPKRLQVVMGHEDITTTMDTYGHLFPSYEEDQKKLTAAELAVFTKATSRDKA